MSRGQATLRASPRILPLEQGHRIRTVWKDPSPLHQGMTRGCSSGWQLGTFSPLASGELLKGHALPRTPPSPAWSCLLCVTRSLLIQCVGDELSLSSPGCSSKKGP